MSDSPSKGHRRTRSSEQISSPFPGIPFHIPADATTKQKKKKKDFPVENTPFPGIALHIVDYQPKTQNNRWKIAKCKPTANTNLFVKLKAMEPNPRSGVYAVQGKRPYMEDKWANIDHLNERLDLNSKLRIAYYAVFDGHKGVEVAQLCQENFHLLFENHQDLLQIGDAQQTLINCFQRMEEQIVEIAQQQSWKSGSTASIVLMIGNLLATANLGDSQIVVGQLVSTTANARFSGNVSLMSIIEQSKYEPVILSTIHKATIASEKERIVSLGGTVVFG